MRKWFAVLNFQYLWNTEINHLGGNLDASVQLNAATVQLIVFDRQEIVT